jgi:hypothetical protein
MFEEISISASSMLVALFWLILALLFVWGLVWAKTATKPSVD